MAAFVFYLLQNRSPNFGSTLTLYLQALTRQQEYPRTFDQDKKEGSLLLFKYSVAATNVACCCRPLACSAMW